MKGWGHMKKVTLIVVLMVLVLIGTAEAAPKGTLSIYPNNVSVAPRARIQFSVLLKKDGLVEEPSRIKITGPGIKRLTPTLIRMSEKPKTYNIQATAEGLTATARITVKNVAPAGKKRNPAPSIRIVKLEKKKRSVVHYKNKHVTARVKVSGSKVDRILLEGLNGKLEKVGRISSAGCKHGDTVTLKGWYKGIKTRFLRFSLLNKGNRVLFKKVVPD